MNLLELIESYADLDPLVEAQNYPAIANYLGGAPLIQNPGTQQYVPVKVNLSDIFYLLQPEEFPIVVKVKEILKVGKELSDIMGESFIRTPADISKMLGEQGISLETKTAIDALIAKVELDPNYQDQVQGAPRWVAAGLGKQPSAEDVQAVLNGVG